MFVRVYGKDKQKEILFDTDRIWKIEVTYGFPKGGNIYQTTLQAGRDNPETVRTYRIFVGDEQILLPSHDDPVTNLIEKIYNDAVKAD